MMKSYLLGIDIGTSACKVAVFDRNGKVLATASGDYPVYYPHEGWAEQNPEEWWDAVCRATKETIQKADITADEIAGIGIDGQSWSAIPIDREGNVLANTPIWMDTRAQSICDRLNQEIGREEIFEVAGNSLQPSYSTAKILWYKENLPEVYAKIYKILQSNSYIAFKLTGAVTQDVSQGYGLHCFNMKKGCWDEKMCKRLGIPMEFLPEICDCDHVVGTVTGKAAAECGLVEGTPVVAGGLDAACGTLGAGVIHSGETQEQGGQAGGMSICTEEYKADPRLILSYHVVPGKWLLQGGTTGGGGVMRWFEHEFADYERMMKEQTGVSSLNQLNKIAEKVGPGCDGMVLRAMGGSAKSLLWRQIKSDMTGKPIIVPESDTATTLGAALLAGVGVRFYKDYEEAVSLTVKETRRHEPDPKNKAVYDKTFETYMELYKSLAHIMIAK